ncbi:calcium calmodulin-dependent kinase type IV-like isoform A [Micractinium conductrix]|uniref:Calcium calmodulin-dependent kinase type IV-like isoform A n=1 Tax=Micractinium conductrix TaxID=554055 RepID=A0A2P6VGL3_9CHLO|nr:calcium calmodulin-dependent kinase type IV-like isoform A [Micractinium conductrix]|eukprot:PSC73234.1 calcium calmodulin-dependent kinase type IV-like isoform A [Micractinium conductrix]
MAALKVVFLQSPAVVDDPEHLELLKRESDLLGMLDHPNIVECKDVVRSPRQLVLVLEWLRGGQVIDRLHELGLQYSEQQAAAIFVQVAAAVAHMHEYRVLHRDIKPENVMFAEPPAEAKAAPLTAAQLQAGRPLNGGGAGGAPAQKMPVVKLVDLGMACLYDPAKQITGPLGSPGFVAPEIIAGAAHAPSMDVFSLGALLFIMLVGRKPFNIKESENLRYALLPLQEAPGLKDPRWLDLSPDAKHLVMGMLAYDPARRLTMPQVLDHEWVVSRGGILPRPLGRDVVFGAATVASIRRLRNLCGGVVAFNRAAAAAGSTAGSKPQKTKGGPNDSAKDVYLRRLKQSQRLDPSARGGTMNRIAASLASSAYARTHDAGGSVNPSAHVGSRLGPAGGPGPALERPSAGRRFGWLRNPSQGSLRGGSVRGGSVYGQDPSVSRRGRLSQLPGGMNRAATTLMLSEMDRASDRSLSRKASGGAALDPWGVGEGSPSAGDAAQGAPLSRRPSTLQLLSAAAKAYLEGSTHGSWRGGNHSAAALVAGGDRSGSAGGALRQVADDSSVSRRTQQAQQGGFLPAFVQHQAAAGGSSSSIAASGSGSADAEGGDTEKRRRGSAAAALAVGATPRPGTMLSRRGSSSAGGGTSLLAGCGSSGVLSSAGGAPSPLELPAAAASPPIPASLDGGNSATERSFDVGRSTGSRPSMDMHVDGMRPPVVVKRQSLDNPLMPAASPPTAGRSWQDVQAQLRQQTRTSREGTAGGSKRGEGTPTTRVVRIKALE